MFRFTITCRGIITNCREKNIPVIPVHDAWRVNKEFGKDIKDFYFNAVNNTLLNNNAIEDFFKEHKGCFEIIVQENKVLSEIFNNFNINRNKINEKIEKKILIKSRYILYPKKLT